MATIIIPTPLRKYAENSAQCFVHADNVSHALVQVTSRYPALASYLFNADGVIPPFINVFVDEHDIRSMNSTETKIKDDSVISIIPAIAGG